MYTKMPAFYLVPVIVSGVTFAQYFQGVPFLPGEATNGVQSLSGVGHVVVGYGVSEAIRWPVGSQVQSLGLPSGYTGSNAACVSYDGGAIAGNVGNATINSAYRWTQSSGLIPIQDFPYAIGMSSDGSTIVGTDMVTASTLAVRWTAAGGVQNFGALAGVPIPGGNNNIRIANAATADGSKIFGFAEVQMTIEMNPEYRYTPFVWDAVNGARVLRDFTGSVFSGNITDTNASGDILCGLRLPPFGEPNVARLFRWTAASGYQVFDFVGSTNGVRPQMTADGSTIVSGANYWSQSGGMRLLTSVLSDAGCNFTGWTLQGAVDISADGRTIVGNGLNPLGQQQGWVATIPAPGAVGVGVITLGALCIRRRVSCTQPA